MPAGERRLSRPGLQYKPVLPHQSASQPAGVDSLTYLTRQPVAHEVDMSMREDLYPGHCEDWEHEQGDNVCVE